MEKYILTFVRGSGSVWVHLSTMLRVQVHGSKILLVQVRFGFTKMKRFIRVYGLGSGSVRHPGIDIVSVVNVILLTRVLDHLITKHLNRLVEDVN